MTCEQVVALAEIAMLAKAVAALCWALAGGVLLSVLWLWWCKS